LSKFKHSLAKNKPKIFDTFIISKQLPKVNNGPLGENWPNSVTLATTAPNLKSRQQQ
jgi:hypothetical protein